MSPSVNEERVSATEDTYKVMAMPVVSRMALLLVVLAGCSQPAAASLLRNHHEKGEQGGFLANVQAKTRADNTPLYNDFLAIMNHAASTALKDQKARLQFDNFLTDLNNAAKKATKDKAYDDFLKVMNAGAAKAYKETRSNSYDEFLGLMKQKADEAYHQQVELPSYDDFLSALKDSTTEALKKQELQELEESTTGQHHRAAPRYEEFLATLKSEAEKAMQKRVFHDLSAETIKKLEEVEAHHRFNPLDHMTGKNKKTKKEKGEESSRKLKEELRQLKAQKMKHHQEGSHHMKKPIMKRINVLRTQLCWKRPNIWQHDKCLRFLGIHCMKESTGEGICEDFRKGATEKCKTSNDPEFKESYCILSEALNEDHEEEEEHEAKDAAEHGGEHGEEHHGEEHGGEHGQDGAANGGKAAGAANGGKAGAGKDGKVGDRDHDGVTDDVDAFPDDPNESGDIDKDGIGDNADEDRDGDGHANDVDLFPDEPEKKGGPSHDKKKKGGGKGKAGGKGKGGGDKDTDTDGDGITDDKDKFPDDPTEWADSDGDGVGDNKDAHPHNPNCHDANKPCNDISKHGKPKPGSAGDPTTLDMDAGRKLPAQGYSETLTGAPVNHENYYSWVGDWQDEFPEMEESEKQTMSRICKAHSTNIWCRRFKNHDAHFR